MGKFVLVHCNFTSCLAACAYQCHVDCPTSLGESAASSWQQRHWDTQGNTQKALQEDL